MQTKIKWEVLVLSVGINCAVSLSPCPFQGLAARASPRHRCHPRSVPLLFSEHRASPALSQSIPDGRIIAAPSLAAAEYRIGAIFK